MIVETMDSPYITIGVQQAVRIFLARGLPDKPVYV